MPHTRVEAGPFVDITPALDMERLFGPPSRWQKTGGLGLLEAA